MGACGSKSAAGDAAPPIIGYHKIRGLAGPLRMMCFYKKRDFVSEVYGEDRDEEWFGKRKPELLAKNACINLPFIVDGEEVVTQSTTCAIYLGQSLGIDTEENFFANHLVLDQVMDLRNDLMKLVYPGNGVTKETFNEKAKEHMAGTANTNLTKLEGLCKGTYMMGAKPESGDFCLWEMLDQHQSICKSVGDADILEKFPKLKALHEAMKAEPELKAYYDHDMYKSWAQNNGLFTFYTGQGDDFAYGKGSVDVIKF
jgi:glutathione S-transferase